MATQSCQEQAFPAKKRGFKVPDPLDIVIDARGKANDTSGIHTNAPPIQLLFHNGAVGMYKYHSIPQQAL